MKSLLAAVGAGVVAITMLAQPADAAPRCVWKGAFWQCWNGHCVVSRPLSGTPRCAATAHSRHMDRDINEARPSHEWRHDRHDWHYGR